MAGFGIELKWRGSDSISFLGLLHEVNARVRGGKFVVNVSRFPEDLSKEFLRQGFREEGVEPPGEVIDEAVEAFDRVIGS